jgi:SPP1 Gp6-like portal protein
MIAQPFLVEVNSKDLSDEETAIAQQLSQRLQLIRPFLQVHEDYYEGEQRISHLGISIPEQLTALRAAVGWPRVAVDVLDERLDVQGFRLPDTESADTDLWDAWMYNGMDTESQLAHLDAFVFGRGFAMAGTNPESGMPPLLTVESPQNMVADWDARTRRVTNALQIYVMDGEECAAIYTPNSTIHLVSKTGGQWSVYDRDNHGMGETPVVMLANRPRTSDRYGRSEITPEIMSITDAACRTLLGMEIAREFFGAPQRYILGATEESFQAADGTPKSAWETYLGRVLALERDEEGNLPTVGQFSAGDPSVYTQIITAYSRIMSSLTGLPPHLLGFTSEQPASAEAIRSSEARLDKRAGLKQRGFSGGWRQLMTLAAKLQNNGETPTDMHRLEVMWGDPGTPTPLQDAQSILYQVQMGYMPATSDIIGEKLGYDSVQRSRIKSDRDNESADQALGDIADAIRSPKYFYTQSVRTAEADNGITSRAPKPKPSAATIAGSASGGPAPGA